MADVRIPPQDIDTEKALLGALMTNPNAMYEVADIVSEDSFYAAKHAIIYGAMLSLYQRAEPIDLVTVSARLKEKKSLEKIGGNTYLSELISAMSNPGSARHYATVVQSKGVLRNLIQIASQIGELGYAEDRAIEDVLDDVQSRIFRIANTSSLQKFSDISSELKEVMERVEKLGHATSELRGVPTGFRALDNKLAGLQKSDLVILAARPSMGKTSLALEIARHAASDYKVPVGIFSLEMSAQQLTERMISATGYVDAWKLRTGKGLSSTDYEHLQQAISTLEEAPIYIDDKSTNTVLAMRSVARRLKSEKNLGLIVIDYLQLITPISSRGQDSMVQQITEISRGLKSMARELNIPVLALSQLSREVEKRGGRPKLSDLRESGSIEQDADVVMFIHREDKEKRYQDADQIDNGNSIKRDVIPVEIIIAKHRNGPVGTVRLHFKENQTRFEEIAKGDYDSQGAEETAVDEF